jgi:hypothetical protein
MASVNLHKILILYYCQMNSRVFAILKYKNLFHDSADSLNLNKNLSRNYSPLFSTHFPLLIIVIHHLFALQEAHR